MLAHSGDGARPPGDGIALLGVGGALVLFGAPRFGAAFRDGLEPGLGIDGLTGFFLATLAVVAAPSLVYARGYLAGVARSRALVALVASSCSPSAGS